MAQATQSMFGLSPELVKLAIEKEEQARMFEQAKLTPSQSTRLRGMQAGKAMGEAVQPLLNQYAPEGVQFGPAEDPRLAESKRLMQIQQEVINSGIDPSDPARFYPALISGMVKGGFIDQARKLQSDYQDQINQKLDIDAKQALAQAKLQAALAGKPFSEQAHDLLKTGKFTPASIEKYAQTGKKSDVELIDKVNTVTLTEGVPGQPDMVQDVVYDKVTREKIILGAPRKRSSQDINIGGPAKVFQTVKDYNDLVEPYRVMLNTAELAKKMINEAASGNTNAWEVARTTIARAAGEGKLSNPDIERMGVTRELLGSIEDWLKGKVTGVPSADTQRKMFVVASVMERHAREQWAKQRKRILAVAEAEKLGGKHEELFEGPPGQDAPKAREGQTSSGTRYKILD